VATPDAPNIEPNIEAETIHVEALAQDDPDATPNYVDHLAHVERLLGDGLSKIEREEYEILSKEMERYADEVTPSETGSRMTNEEGRLTEVPADQYEEYIRMQNLYHHFHERVMAGTSLDARVKHDKNRKEYVRDKPAFVRQLMTSHESSARKLAEKQKKLSETSQNDKAAAVESTPAQIAEESAELGVLPTIKESSASTSLNLSDDPNKPRVQISPEQAKLSELNAILSVRYKEGKDTIERATIRIPGGEKTIFRRTDSKNKQRILTEGEFNEYQALWTEREALRKQLAAQAKEKSS